MQEVRELIAEAQALLRERAPEIRRQAQTAKAEATELMKGVDWLGDRSVGVRLGPQKAWQDDYRFLYWDGPDTPPPGSEQSQAGWRVLSEDEAERLMESHTGSTPELVDAPLEEAVNAAKALRRDLLGVVDPVVQERHFSFAETDVLSLREMKLRFSKDEAMEAIRPTSFIVDRPDAVLGTPLHLGLGTWVLAAQTSANAVEEFLDKAEDLIKRLANRARVSPSVPASVTPGGDLAAAGQPHTHLAVSLAAIGLCIGVSAVALVAAFDANWLGLKHAATWARATAAAVVAVVPTLLACALWNVRVWKAATSAATVFVAVFGIAAVVFTR